MCGIAGLMTRGEPMEVERLTAMLSCLSHRGPEQQGTRLLADNAVWVGLGHARLKIIDLSDAAAQPMGNEDGSVWVVFNGEIYNYRELRATLAQRGVRFRSASDTEVLLRWYEAEGADCLRRFDGMFAMAVWDAKRRRMILARDRVGKKPLFYAAGPDRLAFASEIKALLQCPGIGSEVNRQTLPAFFSYGYVPSPDTLYQGILQLPPGHVAEAAPDGTIRLDAYWRIPHAESSSSRSPTEPEASSRVRELLTAAVRRRLVADVPLGAFLSGGLDSSIIVGIMSRLMPEPVKTFSIGFAKQPYFDETAYARLVAARWRTQHTEFQLEPASVELVERLVWHYDGPFADSSAIPTYLLSQLARRHVTVALTGDGGDELFAGYLRFQAALLAERLPAWARHGLRRFGRSLPFLGGVRGPIRRLQKFADGVTLPLAERFTRWIAVFDEDLPMLLAHRADGASRSLAGMGADGPWDKASPLSKLLRLNLSTYLLDDLLVKMDRCSMAHALEARSPFLDRELLEYVWRLPDHMKLRWGSTKYLLRRACADLVPPAVLRRGKMGFGVPLEAWFASDLRDYLHEHLLTPDARLRRYVNQAYVRQLYDAHLARRADYSDRLWTLLTFEVWLRTRTAWAVPQRAQPAVNGSPALAP